MGGALYQGEKCLWCHCPFKMKLQMPALDVGGWVKRDCNQFSLPDVEGKTSSREANTLARITKCSV